MWGHKDANKSGERESESCQKAASACVHTFASEFLKSAGCGGRKYLKRWELVPCVSLVTEMLVTSRISMWGFDNRFAPTCSRLSGLHK